MLPQVAGFRLEALVGRGAMGEVYRAVDPDGRVVALKLLDPTLAEDARFRKRFLRESGIAAGLRHPNIVSTLAAGEDDGRLYLAMEFVDGIDLRHLLRREGRLDPDRAVQIVAQIAAALDAAHGAGLVHRDVKPGNILLDEADGRAVICDFGLARHVSSVTSLTGDRGFVGTIDYVPPEQIEGAAIDQRADEYSLACVLFECLAGSRPFERDSELSVVFAHLNEPPPKVTSYRPDLPKAFDDLFETALAKDPDSRFRTCGELAAAAAAAARGEAVARPRPRRGRLAALITAVIAIAAAIAVVVAATEGSDRGRVAAREPPLLVHENALNLVDVAARRSVGHVALGKPGPSSIGGVDVAIAGRAAWVLLVPRSRLLRVDLRTRQVTKSVGLPWVPAGRIALGGGMVWVTQDGGPGVLGVDLRSGRVARRFAVDGGNAVGVAYGDGSLWLSQGFRIERIDPRSGHVLHRITEIPGQSGFTEWLTFANGWLWSAAADDGIVRKIDPVAEKIVARAQLSAGWIGDLVVGDGGVWVSLPPSGVVQHLDPSELVAEQPVPAGNDPERLSLGQGRLWVANSTGNALSEIVVSTGARRSHPLSARPLTAAYGRGVLLTAASSAAPLPPISGQEIRISTPTPALDPDPATPRDMHDKELNYVTCANLLVYPDTDGPAGGALRPEVAAAMPRVTAGGRTYTFRIRPGFRFSPPSGEPVTAETFRYTIERALSPPLKQWAYSLVTDIKGEQAFHAGRVKHISGVSAQGNVLRITLTHPDGNFLPLISSPWFCPVPVGTPVKPEAVTGVIARNGPYYVTSFTDERVVLLRNPNYGGQRPRRSARIVFETGTPTREAVALADRGGLDYLPPDFDGGSQLAIGGVLDKRYGPASAAARHGDQRYLHIPSTAWDAVVLNASTPLFRSVRMRRAVEFALDRVALARTFNDLPSESIIPAAVPGFGLARVYPLRGDLAKARSLAGPGRHPATLYYCTNGPFGGAGQSQPAATIRSQLSRIGLDVTIVTPPCGANTRYDANSRRADLVLASGFTPIADADQFVSLVMSRDVLGGALGPGPWRRPAFLARLRRARGLVGDARIAAYRAIERELLLAAPIAVYGSWFDTVGYFSPRVGCRVIPPGVNVVDLAALCKR